VVTLGGVIYGKPADVENNSSLKKCSFLQDCGSGSGFSYFVDLDPYWESGSRGKKIKKFQWKNALFSYFLKKIYH
jgi:hypothetical protein